MGYLIKQFISSDSNKQFAFKFDYDVELWYLKWVGLCKFNAVNNSFKYVLGRDSNNGLPLALVYNIQNEKITAQDVLDGVVVQLKTFEVGLHGEYFPKKTDIYLQYTSVGSVSDTFKWKLYYKRVK